MQNLPITAEDLIGAITKTTTVLASDMSGKAYLKLHKGGFFVYGSEEIEVEENSQWAVNPHSFALGYVAWPKGSQGAPLGEEMRSITDDPVIMSSLPDVDGVWTQQVAMQLMCVSGEDKGTEVVYKASSKGGINGFNDFLNQVLINLKANIGSDSVVPVIVLEVKHYKHPEHGKIYTPVFMIKSWSTMDDMPTPDAEEDEPPVVEPEPEKKALEDKPAKVEPKAAEDKPEKAAKAKSPRRRRRRA